MSDHGRQLNRLFAIEVDEVSSVRKPGNQLGLIAIAKSAEGDMGAGEEQVLDLPDDLELVHGEDYVDDDGNVFTYVELDEEGQPKPVDGLDLSSLGEPAYVIDTEDGAGGESELSPAEDQLEFGKADLSALRRLGSTVKRQAEITGQNAAGRLSGAKAWAKNNPGKAALGGGAALGLAGGGAYMEAKKSAGTEVLEALSKAVTDADRDEVISKMAERTEAAEARAQAVEKALEEERDIRITEAFIAKAAEYDIPADPEEFGPILKACAEVLDDRQLELLDQVLLAKSGQFDEIGYGGGAANSGVVDEVLGLATEVVGKSAGGLSLEQASTAIFDANPAAYEQYLLEQSGR